MDLGPDGEGNVVAVYSRCAQEGPTRFQIYRANTFSLPYPAYAGARLWPVPLRLRHRARDEGRRREHRPGVGDAALDLEGHGALPTIPDRLPASESFARTLAESDIAFARAYERRSGPCGACPYLYTRPLTGGTSERQPWGSRGFNGLPGPVSLDLYGDRLAFVWNHTTNERQGRGVTEVRLDMIGGDHRVLSHTIFNLRRDQNAEFSYATYVSPTGSGGRIYYGFQCSRFGGGARPPRSLTSPYLRYRIATGERSLTGAPAFLISAATDDDVTIFGATPGNGEHYLGPGGQVLREDTGPFRE